MAKVIKKKDSRRRTQKDDVLPLGKQNFVIIGVGVLVVLAGYFTMAQGGVEGFLPLAVAPILLVLGYCVIIPVGILFKKSYIKADSSSPSTTSGVDRGDAAGRVAQG